MFKSTNPTIRGMNGYINGEEMLDEERSASYLGVALKGGYFVGLTLIAAVTSAILLFRFPAAVLIATFVSLGVAFVAALIASFAPGTVRVTGTIYALAEGVATGSVSALVGVEYGGIVFAALMGTFFTFATLLVLYALGWIRVGSGFRRFVIGAFISVTVTHLFLGIASLVSPTVAFFVYGSGVWSVLFSVLMVGFAAAYLLMDMAQITEMVEGRMDRSYEWNAAFGLCVTLVWLYLEMLRLLLLVAARASRKRR